MACIALAVAVAFKVYPVIFGILLLFEKRWKQAIYAVLYGLTAVFLPFLFFEDGFSAIPLLIRNVKLNSQFYHGGPLSLVTNQVIDTSSFMEVGFIIAKIIAIGAIILSGAQKVYWKRIALLTCALILTPTHSGYYCGLYLLIPVLYFLNEENHQKRDWGYLIMFLITLSPLQYTIKLPHFWLLKESVVTSTVQNTTITLLYLFLFIDTIWDIKNQRLKTTKE